MKKSKIALVVVLALVLSIACISVPTFSWYVRPNEQSGNKLSWNSNYTISNGKGISMQTLESKDGGKTYTQNVGSFSNELSAGDCKYYRTEIHNTSTSAQNVSLFLSQLDLSGNAGGKFYLGVNGPLKTYKNYSSSTSSSAVSLDVKLKNVYVGFNVAQSYTPTDYQVHWWVQSNGSDNGDANVNAYFSPNKQGSYNNGTYNMTYATIPWRADSVKLKKGEFWPSADNNNSVDTNNTIIHYLWDGQYKAEYYKSSEAAGLDTFYSSAKVQVGDTVDIPASGRKITYSSSDPDIATVSVDGTVTGVSAGNVTITATSTGCYGDTITADCDVQVYNDTVNNGFDAPIVTNYEIAGTDDSENPTVEYVYWYIKNDSGSELNYNVNGVFLSL